MKQRGRSVPLKGTGSRKGSQNRLHTCLFPNFPRLPVEIRHIIWEMSLPGPRLLTLHIRKVKGGREVLRASRGKDLCRCNEYTDKHPTVAIDFICTATSPSSAMKYRGLPSWVNHREQTPAMAARRHAPIPAALYACRESREIAMKKYTLAFANVKLNSPRGEEISASNEPQAQ
ncbi:hypothetical protein B0J14DRAFT_81202 [Halenospora varia]|nr:hypothetical protein B0J14DRAFT_81202 [Halenospora varia]